MICRWLASALLCALAGACTPDPGAITWRVEASEAVPPSSIASVDAWITPEGCQRELATFATDLRPGEPPAVSVPSLPEGSWGFAAAGLDGECRVVAEGCATAELPRAEDFTVVTRMEPSDGRLLCPGGCVSGRCLRPDAGPDGGPTSDAGLDGGRDGGGRDGGSDAGVDAGADAGWDAGVDACVPATEDCTNGVDDDCDGDADCADGTCATAPACLPCGGSCSECENCVSGSCVAKADGTACTDGLCFDTICCRGCWTGSFCVTGDVAGACGTGGEACVDCRTTGRSCSGGTCI